MVGHRVEEPPHLVDRQEPAGLPGLGVDELALGGSAAVAGLASIRRCFTASFSAPLNTRWIGRTVATGTRLSVDPAVLEKLGVERVQVVRCDF